MIIKNEMSSSNESEVGALYINEWEAVPVLNTLDKINHPQLATQILTDNSATNVIVNNTILQKWYKSIGIHLY